MRLLWTPESRAHPAQSATKTKLRKDAYNNPHTPIDTLVLPAGRTSFVLQVQPSEGQTWTEAQEAKLKNMRFSSQEPRLVAPACALPQMPPMSHHEGFRQGY